MWHISFTRWRSFAPDLEWCFILKVSTEAAKFDKCFCYPNKAFKSECSEPAYLIITEPKLTTEHLSTNKNLETMLCRNTGIQHYLPATLIFKYHISRPKQIFFMCIKIYTLMIYAMFITTVKAYRCTSV